MNFLASYLANRRQKRLNKEFEKIFGFSPVRTPETPKLVHDKLIELATSVWQILIPNDGYYASVAEDERQLLVRARNMAERVGYVVFPLQDYLEMARPKGLK